ncbi:MAG: type II secretion system protein [Vampirovibrionales bacterium]
MVVKTCLKTKKAFTLTELMIALSVLGVIAIFVVPKVLTSFNRAGATTSLKEFLSTYTNIIYDGINRGELSEGMPPQQISRFIISKLNAERICETNGETEGCWSHVNNAAGCVGVEGHKLATAVMPSGLTIGGLTDNNNPSDGYFYTQLDLNGPAEPNHVGDDQFSLLVRLIPTQRPGVRVAHGADVTTGETAGPCLLQQQEMWNSLFR